MSIYCQSSGRLCGLVFRGYMPSPTVSIVIPSYNRPHFLPRAVVSALQEAGLEVVGTSVKKSTKEDKQKLKELFGSEADAHMIDDLSPREMYAMLRDAKADIMLSGGRSQFVALKARMPWMDINQERHHAFAGYEGMVTMVEEIHKALFNPVWREVRTPAPWERIDPLLAEAA